jgi:integrase
VITESENTKILAHLYRDREAAESDRKYQNRIRVARMWHLAWLLGLRYSEVTGLVKSDYNPESGTLRVVRWKTGNVTMFDDLPDEARELLEAAIEASTTDRILSLSGSTPTMFYKILKAAVEAAGLTWGREGIDSVTFHSLRHSFITRMVQVTDIATVASFSGHTNGSEMIPLYSHASPESRKKAMAAMYGNNQVEKLRQIYERVIAGDLDFEGFLEAVN